MISIINGSNQHRLVLQGKLVSPWAAEVRIACNKVKADLRLSELVVEIKDLTAISQAGENVLFELMNEGVRFLYSGVYTKQVLKQIARRAHRNPREVTG